MEMLMQLWLPILLSAVFVFIASSVIHMALKWHNVDYHGFANEDEVGAALGKANPAPGMYMIPYCKDMKDMGSPEMQKKFQDGPVAKIILRVGSTPNMGKPLMQWFLYCVLVSLFCAYIAAHTLAAGTQFLQVFRVVGTIAFMAYAFGSIPNGIWWGNPWGAVLKDLLDGLIYGLATAAAFAWLWPH
jgi:hypothetical protein